MKKLSEEVIGFDDRKFRYSGIIILSFLLPLILFPEHCLQSIGGYIYGVGSSLVYTSILWHLNCYFLFQILKRYPIPNEYVKSIGLQLISIITITAITAGLLGVIELKFTLREGINLKIFRIVGLSVSIALGVSAVYEAIFLFNKLQRSLIETEKGKRAQIESQLNSLRSQVNPHFLFNSLNTLASIIPEDPETSVRYVKELSRVYRYLLEIKDKRIISLREEMKCVEAYLYMLRIRFADGLKVEVDVGSCEDRQIVPLAVQMLIENVVKHNVISKSKPLRITISCHADGVLEVVNNVQLKERFESSTKVGLKNLDERYLLIFDKTIRVEKTDTYFKVLIPTIKVDLYESSHN